VRTGSCPLGGDGGTFRRKSGPYAEDEPLVFRPVDEPGRCGQTRQSRWLLVSLIGCVGYVTAIAFVPGLVSQSPLTCPTQRILGLHCPSCGMTRAIACLVRLDPAGALACNPLVVIAAPFILFVVLDTIVTAAGRPSLTAVLPRWLSAVGWSCFLGAFALLVAVRVASWLAPQCNPDGWGLPPENFPP